MAHWLLPDGAGIALSDPLASNDGGPAAATSQPASRKVLCLSGPDDGDFDVFRTLSEGVEVVTVTSPVRALACLAKGEFTGIYADAIHFAEATDAGRLIQNEQILQAMPDGVVLLAADNTVVWGNGRLKQWSNREQVIGQNFYDVLDHPDILGPEFCPFSTALHTREASASTLRCRDGRHFRVHAAPVIEVSADGAQPPQHLVVTIRDVTQEVQQQQKLAAIHQAGIELADLTTDEVAALTVDERIELLKSNILHFTKDVLHYDVIEVRMLEQSTGELMPLLAVGIKPEAVRRVLYAEAEGNGVTGFVAATGQSYICSDTGNDPIYIEGAQGARSSLTVPLLLHDQVFGTFNVESPDAGAFGEGDMQFLELFCRDLAVAINTLDLLAAEKATTAAASVEAIHSAVAVPVDEILNDAVGVMERYIGHEPDVVERLHRVLRNARDIKQVIQKIGQAMAPVEARPQCVRIEPRPALVGKHILVVDADDTVRGAAHSLLERYHCNVETAHDGKEAIAMFRSFSQPGAQGGQYDAVIADIRMPDMNGYELLLELQKFMPNVPLILMTGFGYDPGHSIVKARQAGLKEVLYKPFRLDQLLETVERQIAQSQNA